ncbi:MAG TPA: hypothetical protein VF316_15810 [Polyangiaceae bacterium]
MAAVLAFQPSARADDETRVDTPVVVAYVAPPAECASTEAFQQLLVLEIARSPRLAETWRYAIVIRRDQGEF